MAQTGHSVQHYDAQHVTRMLVTCLFMSGNSNCSLLASGQTAISNSCYAKIVYKHAWKSETKKHMHKREESKHHSPRCACMLAEMALFCFQLCSGALKARMAIRKINVKWYVFWHSLLLELPWDSQHKGMYEALITWSTHRLWENMLWWAWKSALSNAASRSIHGCHKHALYGGHTLVSGG